MNFRRVLSILLLIIGVLILTKVYTHYGKAELSINDKKVQSSDTNRGFLAESRKNVREEILAHGKILRQAFADGNIELIESLHHPDVNKALGYKDLKNGREDVIEGIKSTLKFYSLEFIENEIESILLKDNIAIEQTKFSIKGISKESGESFIFSGRTMVTYVRHKKSPTGWATIREIIQLKSL